MHRVFTPDCAEFGLSEIELPQLEIERIIEPGRLGNHPLVVEKIGLAGDGQGWENPDGRSVAWETGLLTTHKQLRGIGTETVIRGWLAGKDITSVATVDPEYHLVEDYAATSYERLQYMHERIAPGHRVYGATYSKGIEPGSMVAEAARGTGMLRGLCALAPIFADLELSVSGMANTVTTECNELPRWGTKERADRLAEFIVGVIGNTTVRLATAAQGLEKEIASIRQHAEGTAQRVSDLSQEEQFLVGTVFYNHDGLLVPANQKRALRAEGYKGFVLNLAGCHMTPLADSSTVKNLLEFINMDTSGYLPDVPIDKPYALAA